MPLYDLNATPASSLMQPYNLLAGMQFSPLQQEAIGQDPDWLHALLLEEARRLGMPPGFVSWFAGQMPRYQQQYRAAAFQDPTLPYGQFMQGLSGQVQQDYATTNPWSAAYQRSVRPTRMMPRR